jgi:hypothetical protein
MVAVNTHPTHSMATGFHLATKSSRKDALTELQMTTRPVQFPGINALLGVLACTGLIVMGSGSPTAPRAQLADASPTSCRGSAGEGGRARRPFPGSPMACSWFRAIWSPAREVSWPNPVSPTGIPPAAISSRSSWIARGCPSAAPDQASRGPGRAGHRHPG